MRYFITMLLLSGFTNVFCQPDSNEIDFHNLPDVFPGTHSLNWDFDVSEYMITEAHELIDKEIDESIENRKQLWNRDFTSIESYKESIYSNRLRFMSILGIPTNANQSINYNSIEYDAQHSGLLEKYSYETDPIVIGETSKYRIFQVRWPMAEGVWGEGLLLTPKKEIIGNVIALPDVDQTPEQLVGMTPGISNNSQFARHLAENGFQVLIPLLINRTTLFKGQLSQQTYRERLYRQAYHMGEHIIGLEVRKIMAAVDWFYKSFSGLKIGIAGYNEGGLLAYYSAAVDQRIDVCLVSGYFNTRQNTWKEPLYRNVWGLLNEFGDAEIASLIAPRSLIVEHSFVPELMDQVGDVTSNPDYDSGLTESGFKGLISTPDFNAVQSEFKRIDSLIGTEIQNRSLIAKNNGPVDFGSPAALDALANRMGEGNKHFKLNAKEVPNDQRLSFDPSERQKRQYIEIENYLQRKVELSDQTRENYFLKKAEPQLSTITWSTKAYRPYFDPQNFIENSKAYRRYLSKEIFGTFEHSTSVPRAYSRKIYDAKRWTGYEVVLDLLDGDFFAAGIMLLPKDLDVKTKRPVVLCQHGRGGLPQQLVEGDFAYNNAGARLAERGFIVFAPYAPFRGEDKYRWLDRKANTVKRTLFSFIIEQHEGILDWLSSLDFVDEKRIGLYGLSYGGEVAIRVPAVLERYSVAICSGDFGHWTRKVADIHFPSTFMNTREWEMPYFNMGNTFSYSDLAYLIFPRAFMVERGHFDGVHPDEWVGYEYAKVNYLYDLYNLGGNCDIEYFNGGHSMRMDGSFQFLHDHLKWP